MPARRAAARPGACCRAPARRFGPHRGMGPFWRRGMRLPPFPAREPQSRSCPKFQIQNSIIQIGKRGAKISGEFLLVTNRVHGCDPVWHFCRWLTTVTLEEFVLVGDVLWATCYLMKRVMFPVVSSM